MRASIQELREKFFEFDDPYQATFCQFEFVA
jgi:hypothetical protein